MYVHMSRCSGQAHQENKVASNPLAPHRTAPTHFSRPKNPPTQTAPYPLPHCDLEILHTGNSPSLSCPYISANRSHRHRLLHFLTRQLSRQPKNKPLCGACAAAKFLTRPTSQKPQLSCDVNSLLALDCKQRKSWKILTVLP